MEVNLIKIVKNSGIPCQGKFHLFLIMLDFIVSVAKMNRKNSAQNLVI